MPSTYHPISCAAHDGLLELATLRRECDLELDEGDGIERVRGIIVDVFSREGAEYLRLRSGRSVRLDRLISVDGRPVSPA